MNTILTDDERPEMPEPRVPMDNHQSTWDKYSSAQMEAYADAREAAVLAKLAQQEPVAWRYKKEGGGWFVSDNEPQYVEQWNDIEEVQPLYTHPAPQQADRQRVPDGMSEINRAIAYCAAHKLRELGIQWDEVKSAWVAAAPEAPAQHIDDAAVDDFARAMKIKLAEAREKGRSGWATCPPEDLSRMLREHVEKGDPRDVANFCMFLWCLGHGIAASPEAPAQASAVDERDRKDAERYRWLRKQHWTENLIGVVIRPKDNARLGSMLPSLELLDDTIDHMQARAALAQKGDAR